MQALGIKAQGIWNSKSNFKGPTKIDPFDDCILNIVSNSPEGLITSPQHGQHGPFWNIQP